MWLMMDSCMVLSPENENADLDRAQKRTDLGRQRGQTKGIEEGAARGATGRQLGAEPVLLLRQRV